eukprot:scaffold8685_cov82-Phaeocystis_antarctica.AAC.1
MHRVGLGAGLGAGLRLGLGLRLVLPAMRRALYMPCACDARRRTCEIKVRQRAHRRASLATVAVHVDTTARLHTYWYAYYAYQTYYGRLHVLVDERDRAADVPLARRGVVGRGQAQLREARLTERGARRLQSETLPVLLHSAS